MTHSKTKGMAMTNPLNDYATVRALVASAGSRFFSIEFVKKNGDYRKMQVQQAAARTHAKGDTASESAQRAVATRAKNNPNLLNVWSVDKRAFRSVNMDTLRAITVDGHRYEVSAND
jgi:hypothetical protein